MAGGVKLDTTEIERARARLIGLVAETDVQDISPNLTPVSYTHLTLPTKA